MGAAALLVASGCPPTHSPSHIALDSVWAAASEARIPIVFHVGGTGQLIDPNYFNNGLPVPPDFHGGDENFRSVDYMGIPGPPAQTLATMIFDGVFERFPESARRRDRAGSDLGAVVDAADGGGFRRVRPPRGSTARRCRCDPANTCAARCASRHIPPKTSVGSSSKPGPEVCMFSSDYPHVEGGRRPIERFEASLTNHVPTPRGKPSTTTTSST